MGGGGGIRTRARCRGHGRRRGRGVRCRRRRGVVVEGRREVVLLVGGVEGMVVVEVIEMEGMVVVDIGIGMWVATAAGTGMGIGAGGTAGRLSGVPLEVAGRGGGITAVSGRDRRLGLLSGGGLMVRWLKLGGG